MPVLEAGNYAYWIAKQTARGTPAAVAATGMRRLRVVGGGLGIQRGLGSERYADGNRFNNAADYTDSLVGGGDLTLQAQPDTTAVLLAWFCGSDVVTGLAPYVHTIEPLQTGSSSTPWLTCFKRVGGTDPRIAERYADTKISSVAFSAGTGQKVAHVTTTLQSLDPGQRFATDPTAGDEGATDLQHGEPWLWQEAANKWDLNGTPYTNGLEIRSFGFTLSDNYTGLQGDDIFTAEFVPGIGTITGTFTLIYTSEAQKIYNLIHYGTATPGAAADVVSTVYRGSIETEFVHTFGAAATQRSLKVTLPEIRYSTDVVINGNPDGTPQEVPFNFEARIDPSTGKLATFVVKNATSAVS